MEPQSREKAKQCCTVEYNRLVSRLDRCDMRTRTGEDRHQCYLNAARKSGHRAKQCMIGD